MMSFEAALKYLKPTLNFLSRMHTFFPKYVILRFSIASRGLNIRLKIENVIATNRATNIICFTLVFLFFSLLCDGLQQVYATNCRDTSDLPLNVSKIEHK